MDCIFGPPVIQEREREPFVAMPRVVTEIQTSWVVHNIVNEGIWLAWRSKAYPNHHLVSAIPRPDTDDQLDKPISRPGFLLPLFLLFQALRTVCPGQVGRNPDANPGAASPIQHVSSLSLSLSSPLESARAFPSALCCRRRRHTISIPLLVN